MLHQFTKSFFILIFLGGIAYAQAPQEKPDQTISKTLISGVTETINLEFMPGNIVVGNKGVCDFVALREQKQLVLVPKQKGQTSLTILDTQGRSKLGIKISVIESDRAKIAKELQELLGDLEGINIRILGKKVLIDGEILLPKDLARIITVANQYSKDEVGIIASLSPMAQKIIADKIQEDVHKMGFKEVRVRAVNQRFIIEGEVPRGPEGPSFDRNSVIVIETAKTYVPDIFKSEAEKQIQQPEGGPPIVVNLLTIKPKPAAEPEKLIRLVVHYVELNKDYAKNFAFNWTPGIADTSQIELKQGQLTTTVTGTISSLIPKLNSAKSHGHARILESSSLIVQDKENGFFQSVTEVPISTITLSGGASQQSIQFKDIGLTMDVTPTVVGESNNIKLVTKFILSTIVSVSEQGAPSVAKHELKTTLIVASEQSAVIGGIVFNNMLTNYNKLPASIAQNQNILFNLYRSKSFQNAKSQFVVFITPQILKSASEGVEDIKRKFKIK
ncbi:MAG: hypothetical protein A2Z91_03200 [Deltaproteobacteria bacterium GWA2_38_16]|nr:MAG: hypothetical protein A2Z91_03200 [Deltaproteobacteria bacterium GWA2_38_16]OGQ02892.1 MAG: hypothetical protein A3D19_06625 [Deltaproteobacteria bacterium RIFCSPHIGHO2_02_FULL_38_15]OGQ35093.1 MAG: hypothetical protein A3A72_03555 [Deltaproteobacteria bacterium RIFCSPLOWO2_01_FULL_38_9]OGQ63430.1 MAG: hypothetical protein A3G92_07060 [Deltaproteobacteria bacterium RIFCSPLOWO2_12_FULL_38_8]HBQ21739.1 pilus assembly protein [Deltaproteobacteria bacterium]